MVFWILLALVIGLLAYIRLAPTDVARWHVPITATEDKKFAGGVIRFVPGDEKVLQKLTEIAASAPRTSHVAGTATDGMVTFVSRSQWIGFPDYTTFQLVDNTVRIHARLRFGRSDLGVNAGRVDGWLDQL